MSGVVCRVPPRGGFRYSARGTEGLSVVDRQRVPFLLAQERNQRRARGALPLRPPRRLRLACGQSRRRPVTDERTSLQQPASRRAAGAMPLPVSLRNRIGSASGEARPLLRGAQRPRGGGKLRGFAAHARRACERPERALFSAAGFGEPSGFNCWERPQPELSLQLVYPWGVAVVCGLWQGTPGGFSRGLAEVPLSALLPPTSWARKKSARPPGRDPAIFAAEGGTSGAARRGAKKAPPGAARQIQTVRRAANQKRNAAPGAAFLLAVRSPRQRV